MICAGCDFEVQETCTKCGVCSACCVGCSESIRDPRLGDLIALDPSIKSAGIAHFRGGVLHAVARFKCNPEDGDTDGSRSLRMAQRVLTWITGSDITPRMLVSEFPQIYGVGVSKADPATITPMACMMGFVGGMLFSVAAAQDIGFQCATYLPRQWKGTRSKEAVAADITGRLTPDELMMMPKTLSDEWDAVGIGLYALGRLKPVRVFSGAV